MSTQLEKNKSYLTALNRFDFSRPIKISIQNRIINSDSKVFDYGCGLGDDVRYLNEFGIKANGWDPNHFPENKKVKSDIVNLGYVINVLDNNYERIHVLKDAWSCTEKALIVSARLTNEINSSSLKKKNDGYVTKRGTFQKFFTQEELKNFIDVNLKIQSEALAPGVFVAFKHKQDLESFRFDSKARDNEYITYVPDYEKLYKDNKKLLEPLLKFFLSRGRPPQSTEIKNRDEYEKEFGTFNKVITILQQIIGKDHIEKVAIKRKEDLLLYIALSKFNSRPKISELPQNIKLDVKYFYKNYKSACTQADKYLLSAGNLSKVSQISKAIDIGKKTRDAIYFHVDCLPHLPLILRIYEGCARSYIGTIEGANIIKMNLAKPKISYLSYSDFDNDAHPELMGAVVVSLDKLDVKFFDNSVSNNRPILHRKELFVPDNYPQRQKFQSLSKQEERYGLLNNKDIGRKLKWESLLKNNGLRIEQHKIIEYTLEY